MRILILFVCLFVIGGCAFKINPHQESGIITEIKDGNTYIAEVGFNKRVFEIDAKKLPGCKVGTEIKITLDTDESSLKVCEIDSVKSHKHLFLHTEQGSHKWGHIKPSSIFAEGRYNNRKLKLIDYKKAAEVDRFSCTTDSANTQFSQVWMYESDYYNMGLQNLSSSDEPKCAVIGFLYNKGGASKYKVTDLNNSQDYDLIVEAFVIHPEHK